MNVSAILKQKGNAVSTTSAAAKLMDAARDLSTKKIGALVVTDSAENVVGIISERDIVRVIAEGGADMLSASINDVMTRNVITCSETATLHDMMSIMTHGRFRHLPVVDASGKLIGIAI